jgi:LmbE family N-acetylglucosaminyl deacetylase
VVPLEVSRGPLTILCLGAHSDDIEIGCGGTLLRLLSEHPGSTVRWVVFSASSERSTETHRSAECFLAEAGETQVDVHRFRESYFPFVGAEIKDAFETLKSTSPDLVFTHRTDDSHQDHRTIGQFTWNTFRDHAIFEYEIPKYEGDLGHPNVFVPLDSATAERKVESLMRLFPSQQTKRWFRRETFSGLMAIRGVESNSPSGLAEGFHVRKIVL